MKENIVHDYVEEHNNSITLDTNLNKIKEIVRSSESRRSQRNRREKHLNPNFISFNHFTFLVVGSKDRIIRKLEISIDLESERKTSQEA